jgi:hypothetical protein
MILSQSFISPANAQPICLKILKFILYFNVNSNTLKQIGCSLVGVIKDLDNEILFLTTTI